MCVILAPDQKPVTADMIKAAHETNGDGMGVAWRAEVDGVKVVKWKKGITLVDEAVALVEKLPLPYIFHARRQTVGPKVPEMCHPFPVSLDVSLDLEGTTPGAVIFHNGTWKDWSDEMKRAAYLKNIEVPRAPHSDSRIIAWVTHFLGKGFLDELNEKVIWFHATEEHEVFGKDRFREANDSQSVMKRWTEVNGIFCSNTEFTKHLPGTKSDTITPIRQIINKVRGKQGGSGGDRNPSTNFRPGPTQLGQSGSGGVQEDQNLQERLQEGSAGLREAVSKGVVCVVSNVGNSITSRGPLITSTKWAVAYEKAHGHPLPRLVKPTHSDALIDPRMQIIGNVKKYRSSGLVGDYAATTDEANLLRARKLADTGISRIIH